MKKLIVLATLSLAFTAPVHAGFFSVKQGTQVSQEQFDGLVVGKARKTDVTEAIGHPDRREQLGDNQVWYYEYTKLAWGRSTDETTTFEFDKNGILVDKYRTGNGESGKSAAESAK